jgi:hypothetical protein
MPVNTARATNALPRAWVGHRATGLVGANDRCFSQGVREIVGLV